MICSSSRLVLTGKKQGLFTLTVPSIKGNAWDEERLREISPKWVAKYHAVDRICDGNTNGFLDIGAGITLADKVIERAIKPWSAAN